MKMTMIIKKIIINNYKKVIVKVKNKIIMN